MTSRRITAGLRTALLALLIAASGALPAQDAPQAKYPDYPSETPASFKPATADLDYVERGVKLNTVILIPKGAQHAGIVLTRTPYDAHQLSHNFMSGHLEPLLQGYDNAADVIVEDGYIRVIQDIRGKYGSEGDYVMNRP